MTEGPTLPRFRPSGASPPTSHPRPASPRTRRRGRSRSPRGSGAARRAPACTSSRRARGRTSAGATGHDRWREALTARGRWTDGGLVWPPQPLGGSRSPLPLKVAASTLLLAAACLVGAAPAVGAPAAGRTAQHAGRYGAQRLPSNAVSFTFARGKVSRFSIPWVAPCTNTDVKGAQPPLLDRMVITDGLPVRRGLFTATGEYDFPPGTSQSATVKFALSGTVRGGRAS